VEIGSETWLELLIEGAARLGVAMNREQAGQLALHGRQLLEWNQKVNLTAITDPEQIAVKHFLDAIAPLNHIPAHGRILDIGTGGGFPGLPLKVMRPGIPMTLIDGVRKKISFVQEMIRQLGLQRIEALHTRAEALAGQAAYAQGFQTIVCRALTDMDRIVKLAVPLLAPGGCILAYKGPQAKAPAGSADRPASIDAGGRRFRATLMAYRLPRLGDPRTIVVWQSLSG
jgi:16S rRNA (guanine527-N7)-methyltransferase